MATTAGKPTARRAAAQGALFTACVQQHHDKREQHHDRAGIDDDLRGGQKLRAKQQIKHGQRGHHHDQREGAVDGMALEQQIDGPGQAESGKKEKQNQVHRSLAYRVLEKGQAEKTGRLGGRTSGKRRQAKLHCEILPDCKSAIGKPEACSHNVEDGQRHQKRQPKFISWS